MYKISAREMEVAGAAAQIVGQEENRDPLPQFDDVIQLVNSIDRKMEDCAVEWQAKISQAQWRIVDRKAVDGKPWEQSVLSRTYFAEKKLDVAFQTLLRHKKTFSDHLHGFVAMVQGKKSPTKIAQTCNTHSQCSDLPNMCDAASSSLDVSVSNKTVGRRGRKSIENVLDNARDSFTGVIKAKINFDTKFLGFEALLNQNSPISPTAPISLDKLCSSVLGTACEATKNVKKARIVRRNRRYSNRIKQKRLMKSPATTVKTKALQAIPSKNSKIPVSEDLCCVDSSLNIGNDHGEPAST